MRISGVWLGVVLLSTTHAHADAGAPWTAEVSQRQYLRPGELGRSQLRVKETSWQLQRRFPSQTDWTLLIDRVHLDAGVAAGAFNEALQFGKANALLPDNVDAPSVRQQVTGQHLGTALHIDRWHADVGVIGLGLPTHHWVGGISHDTTIFGRILTLGIARRALTDSLLSYAGTADPLTGEIWGGAVIDQGQLTYSNALGQHAWLWLRASSGRITGTQIAKGKKHEVMASLTRPFALSHAWTLSAGLFAHWRQHPHNYDHYTFGQGGYWSPQQYQSLGVPLRLQFAQSRWSFELFTQWSYSHIRNSDTIYFPAHPELQAAYPDSVFPGQVSKGRDLSLAIDTAFRITPRWTLGLQASRVHAIDYRPRQLQLFVRFESVRQSMAPATSKSSYAQY